MFSGNRVPAGADPFATAYGGHQFGYWAGQLGDGRAIALGEVRRSRGDHQTLQLKGAGPTPYSRTADGRAVLRSSLREFLCSEAMHHLGVPTTRALSLVATGDQVMRDVLYDGRPAAGARRSGLPGRAVVHPFRAFPTRGCARRSRLVAGIGRLHHPPRLPAPPIAARGRRSRISARHVGAWFAEVCDRTATLAVDWMRVGFVHGVMNTDNMSILGLTIDYGPYGWLESFDPNWTPNTTDAAGRRYRYAAQPQIVQWNLLQLANSLVPLVDDTESAAASARRLRLCLHRSVPGDDDGATRVGLASRR